MVESSAPATDRAYEFSRSLMKFLMNAALVVAPTFLGGLAIFFVCKAFFTGIGPGFRSLAAVVFPLMVLAFVYAGRKMAEEAARNAARQGVDSPEEPVDPRPPRPITLPDFPVLAAVATMAAAGAVSMLLLELSTTIPIVELVLATGFSFIVYVLGEGRHRAAPYCLGLVIGSLAYVIIIGVPHF